MYETWYKSALSHVGASQGGRPTEKALTLGVVEGQDHVMISTAHTPLCLLLWVKDPTYIICRRDNGRKITSRSTW